MTSFVKLHDEPPKLQFMAHGLRKTSYRLVPTSGETVGSNAHIIQAQYYRDPALLDTYLASNHFLTSINNEIPTSRNQSYARNLASLPNLVLVLFTEDKTVVPKESAWFGSESVPAQDMHFSVQNDQTPLRSRLAGSIIPMRQQPLYREDWIGLRELDERKGIMFEQCHGGHMQMNDCWEDLVRRFTGSIV